MDLLNPIIVLIALTVLVSAYAWSNPEVMERWILWPYRMSRQPGELYRLLTSGFLHADWGHLLFNMIAFYSFGSIVLGQFQASFGASKGLGYFLLLYLGGIIISDLPTYFRHRDDPGYRSLGASGGVASVLFAGVLFAPLNKIYIMFLPVGIPGFLFGFLYLVYSYYMGRRRGDNINHDAHFYGALYGVLLTVLLLPAVLPYFLEQVRGFRF
ncbi:rhomboid family intramembrane serine protease [uncultured Hymenobacter sp.]|uniref:rhomboid family intramembrane serine protease n=1 Tax=uncultured Hymenobacter sp. TaxID=170016 RepID=UPI0035C97827